MNEEIQTEQNTEQETQPTVPVKPPVSAYKKLKRVERKFVDAYLSNGFKIGQAGKTVGFLGAETAIRVRAHRLFYRPEIQAAIKERFVSLAMQAEETVYRISKIAEGSITDFVDEDGNFDLQKIKTQGKGGLIKKLKLKRKKQLVGTKIVGSEDSEEATETIETSILDEDVEIELYSAHEALRDLLKVHKVVGNTNTILLLTPEQVKNLSDKEINELLNKLNG